MSDPMLPVGTNRCLCAGCGRYFGGVSAFDAHQTLGPDGRPICHDPASLTRKDGTSLGYIVNDKGFWVQPMPDGIVFAAQGVDQNEAETADTASTPATQAVLL